MSLSKIITVALFCSSLLMACSTTTELPSKRKPPVDAKKLATTHLPPPAPVVNSPPSHGFPVAELPVIQPQPLKEVNKLGQVPAITTLTDRILRQSDINLSDEDPIQLDFEQVTLREILEIIGDALNISLVIDPTIGDKVTIRTAKDKPLTKKDLWPLLQLLLSDAGITMEKKGGIYHLKKTAPTLPGIIGIAPETLTSSTSPEVLQVTPLRYLMAEAAQAVINPLIQPKGRVITLPTLNVIGIITSPKQLERVNKLLRIIDADPFLHRGMRLFRLTNSKATDVQTELDKILKALYGNTPSAYQIIALERINAILAIAPPNSGFNEVALWVEILDERSEESGEQIFIYKVKNLEASKLASTLTSVFKIEDKKAAEEKKKRQRNETSPTPPLPEGESPTPTTPFRPPIQSSGGTLPVSAELKVTIVADESTNSLLIRATSRDYRQLLETIYALDQVPKEVMINVVIAEVQLTEATKFGIDWQALFGSGERSYVQTDFKVPTAGDEDNPITGLVVNHIAGSLKALLNLVSSTNDVNLLSRPSLLVRNNEEASMNVGSNEPFLSGINSSTVNNSLLSNDVQYKDTGITLKITPRINDDGIINLKVYQETSQLGPERTTQNLQSFTQRKVETSVVVRDGGAIVISGLMENRNRNAQQSIPGLRKIPIIGRYLFTSDDQETVRTELVIIIVPQIVNPEADNRPMVHNFRRRMQLASQLLNEQDVFTDELDLFIPPRTVPLNNDDKNDDKVEDPFEVLDTLDAQTGPKAKETPAAPRPVIQ